MPHDFCYTQAAIFQKQPNRVQSIPKKGQSTKNWKSKNFTKTILYSIYVEENNNDNKLEGVLLETKSQERRPNTEVKSVDSIRKSCTEITKPFPYTPPGTTMKS